MSLCPCCKQELPGFPDLVISLESNTAVARGHFVKLQPDHAVLAYALRNGWPGTVTYHDLEDAMWGGGKRPVESYGILRTQIYRLRRSLAPLQYSIACTWKEGFRLVDQAPPWAVNIHSSEMIGA